MKVKFILLNVLIISSGLPLNAQIEQSYFKLTTSNGLIAAVYDVKKNSVDYVYPHIFANYDSGKFVHPFIANIRMNRTEQPIRIRYLNNTHVITAEYKNYTLNYFSPFTSNDKIFYILARGKKEIIENLSFNADTGNGKVLSNISLLENPLEDLPISLSGNVITGTLLRRYDGNVYEKYFLFSFIDSLHKDNTIITKAARRLSGRGTSLLDDELQYMQKIFSSCKIPCGLSVKERNVVEQSVSFLKMAQVSDQEIFPFSHGQILASLRPGLWHIAWVRDGSYAIQAMTRLGMYSEAKKGLEFMLNAHSGQYKHYIYHGKDYGAGIDYQISMTRYFGSGREESDFNEYGPNIEFDNFGLFLCAFCDYAERSRDSAFYKKWNQLVTKKVADATVACIDADSLIREDSGPWEHHLQIPKQYTFTSGVCARGLEQFAKLQKQFGLQYKEYEAAAAALKEGILKHMLCDNKYFKGNINDQMKTDHEYYDAGVFEIFANGLIEDKNLFLSHMKEYDKVLRIKGKRSGYIRLNSLDPYENQEWVFINLRIALAYLLFDQKTDAAELLNHVTEQAAVNYNTIPEMYSNSGQLEKMNDDFKSFNVWCNCIRDKGDQYIGAIPMIGYGAGAYILTLLAYHEN
ncbi:MAG TPA: hypothetical protein VMT35_07020 [Ignavibacteriaceae bacterium]|nr:hypothetical protein [Ignavibacteriaceae bacterium]